MINFTSNFTQNEVGLFFKNEKFFLFFGNKNSTLDQLLRFYPNFTFLKIKQTHSDKVVEASGELIEADAHYTADKNTALLVSTADCLPALIYCHQTHRVAAVHAGWRGIENQIVIKSLIQLEKTGSTQKKFEIFVGPHLLQDSFEIDLDVFLKLQKVYYGLDNTVFYKKLNNKYYVDLNQIFLSQIKTVIKKDFELNFVSIDTKINSDFWSYRRDKDAAGRNLSFIAALT